MRAYRERKKQKKIDEQNTENPTSTLNFTKQKQQYKKIKHTERGKNKKKIDEQNKENPTSTLNFTKPAAKTAVQRNKAYRERLKQKKNRYSTTYKFGKYCM